MWMGIKLLIHVHITLRPLCVDYSLLLMLCLKLNCINALKNQAKKDGNNTACTRAPNIRMDTQANKTPEVVVMRPG